VRPGLGWADQELAKGFGDPGHADLWEAVYSVLSHSANLSKVFWVNSAANAELRVARSSPRTRSPALQRRRSAR